MDPNKTGTVKKHDTQIVNDIVHGIIILPDYIQVIIDTPQFQRLRHISQLGFASFVYPSSNYSRFEHSIGTFHLASKLIKRIKFQLEEEGLDELLEEDEIKCVEIAALCHDLGHGPFSHFWEHAFDESIPTRPHEVISAEIFKVLINSKKSGHSQSIKEIIDLNDDKIELIERIISGKFDETKDQNKRFLFEIVANKESGLDVDKFDYICRDSIYFGWSNKNKIHDIKRIMYFFRVVKNQNSKTWHLAMRDREIFHIHDVFYYRHLLHRYGYQHKTVKVIECFFKKALKKIINNEKHRDEFIENVLLSKQEYKAKIWFSKKFISKVCGYHVWDIMKKYTSDIATRIQERNLYKVYCQIHVLRKENIQNGNIKTDLKNIKNLIEKLKTISADVSSSAFTLQSENNGNPLLSIRFYKKTEKTKYFKFDENSLPDLVNLKCDELIITIFKEKTDENVSHLETIKELLCSEIDFDENQFPDEVIKEKMKELKTEIKTLHQNYKFKENLY